MSFIQKFPMNIHAQTSASLIAHEKINTIAQSLSKAKPKARLLVIEGMNHVLKDAPADRIENTKTYSNPNLLLSKRLVDGIVSFVKR